MPAQTTTPSGEDLIEQMHHRWKGKWGRNMRFDQHVYHYKNDSLVKQEVWQEILSSPGNLQIRFDGFETGNGILFRNDSVYHFRKQELVRKEDRVHHLLLLGFDVFFLSPEETISKLQDLRFDLSRSYRRETPDGPQFVIGTDEPGDMVTSQFWIDAENLYLTKVILEKEDTLSEVEMTNYRLIDSYPVATVVLFRTNGELVMKEEYFDISFPEELDLEIFAPEKFGSSQW